jgi:endoglucanase
MKLEFYPLEIYFYLYNTSKFVFVRLHLSCTPKEEKIVIDLPSRLQTLFLITFVTCLQGCRANHRPASNLVSSSPAVPSNGVAVPIPASPDTGYWHTSGQYILDRDNNPIRIQGISWYGLETKRKVLGGLNDQDYHSLLDLIRANGFNTVRIPFSDDVVEHPLIPNDISYKNQYGPINQDLRSLNSLEVLDRLIDYAGHIGLKVILDNHRSEAGDDAQQNGLWYTNDYPEALWINDWKLLATRYRNNSTVIGMDLRNEPHSTHGSGACWDCGGPNDWHLAAARAGNAILAIEPRLLVFVEGVDSYNGDTYWWGGNLEGVQNSPVALDVANRLVYSTHVYGPSNYPQRWFNSNTTTADLDNLSIKYWAYVSLQGIAPVWVGEFGTDANSDELLHPYPGSEGQWFQSLTDFLSKHPEIGWTLWSFNGEDPRGYLDKNYQPKYTNDVERQLLSKIEAPIPQPSLAPAKLAPAPTQYAATFPTRPLPPTPRYTVPRTAQYTTVVQRQPMQSSQIIAAFLAAAHVSSQPTQPPQAQLAQLPQPPAILAAPQPGTSPVSTSCSVSYRVLDDTGGTITAAVQIHNLSPAPIDGWTLLWLYPSEQQVEHVTNALIRQNNDLVIMSNARNNATIPPGGRLSGITLETVISGRQQSPQRFYLNGHLCS